MLPNDEPGSLERLLSDNDSMATELQAFRDKLAEALGRELALRQEVEKLRGALSFYGDHLSYGRGLVRFEGTRPDVMKDNGGLARRVLQQTAQKGIEDDR
jgi:hypothetical protein